MLRQMIGQGSAAAGQSGGTCDLRRPDCALWKPPGRSRRRSRGSRTRMQPRMPCSRRRSGSGEEDGGVKANAALPGDGVDPSTPSMKEHEDQLYSGLEAVRIVNLPPGPADAADSGDDSGRAGRVPQEPEPERAGSRCAGTVARSRRRSLLALQGSERLIDAGTAGIADDARHLQRAAVAGGDDGLLAEPLQRVSPGRTRMSRTCCRRMSAM